MLRPILPQFNTSLNIAQFYQQKDRILIIRELGGAGDILMHRMLFEDFHLQSNCKIDFACPKQYHDLVIDHPYISCLLDSNKINHRTYAVSYNTTKACREYESRIAPKSSLHRSDIWASHCGIKLQHHNMHINLTTEERQKGTEALRNINPDKSRPTVLLCPVSAISLKNLMPSQISFLTHAIETHNGVVVGCHNRELKKMSEIGKPTIMPQNMRDWMAIMAAADYCVSVDTGAFHLAGGLGVPLLGIFSYTDGKVYSKYYEAETVQKHRDNGDWECGPCYLGAYCKKTNEPHKPCVTELSEEKLFSAVEKMFKRWPWKSL